MACSGGVDSMVLCQLLNTYGFSFQLAHCNFQLRGHESDADEALVRSYGAINSIPVHVKNFETEAYALQHKVSVQVAARELRYEWFYQLLNELHFDCLLTAHHADDNVETVLMNLFKGTGIHGMKGILPKQKILVRPLLFATKSEIVTYAKQHSVEWREDASNASDKYTRNFLRNNIIPQVEKVIPNAAANIYGSIRHFAEADLLYQQAIEMHRRQLFEYKKQEVHIPVLKLGVAMPFDTIAFELFKPFGFNAGAVADIKKLLKADTGKYIASNTHRVIKNRKWLIVAPLTSAEPAHVTIDREDDIIAFELGTIYLSITKDTTLIKDPQVALLDAKNLNYPLLLRKWKQGDYFYPLGMPKKKKIARFLIDQKLSQTQKENTWVLVSNNKIVWVVGHRIDDRFKISFATKEVAKFRLVPGS